MVGTSGTVDNFTDIAVQHFDIRSREPGDLLSFEQLKRTSALLRQRPLEKGKLIPGINPKRADITVASSAILFVIMYALSQKFIHINERGLRDGLLFDYLQAVGGETAVENTSFRKARVLRLGRAVGFEEVHARHVSFMALQLFDNARRTELHNLGDWERELLEYAALLHDIGISLSYDGHHRHSFYFIKHAELLGFTKQEIEIIAAVARYHHKPVSRSKHPEFDSLSWRSQEIVTVLSDFLSIAESLDRSHAQLIESTEFSEDGRRKILLHVHAKKDSPSEKWSMDYHCESF